MRSAAGSLTGTVAAVLAAASVTSCNSDHGNAPASPIIITTTVTPSSLIQGQSFSASVTATPPAGERLASVKVEVQGLFTVADSIDVLGDGSATITRTFRVPTTVPNGSITVLGSARTTNGHRGTGETNVAVADRQAPTVTLNRPPGATVLQPGDTLKLSLVASDNIALRYTVIRVTGAFSLVDSTAYTTTTSTSKTLAVPVPATARLGTAISAVADVADYAGNATSTPAVALQYGDVTPPVVSVAATGGRGGTGFAPGEILTLAVNVSDNHRLARVGYRMLPPASGGDSSTITAATYTQNIAIPIQATWEGTPSYVVFAVDSTGNRRETLRTLVVANRTRRPVMSAALVPGVRDAAIDTKRGVAYLSLQPTSVLKVMDLATGTFKADIPLPSPAGGIDLSTGGDSLLVAQTGAPLVRVIPLTGGPQDTVRVSDPTDSRSAANLRVTADNTMLVTLTFAGSGYGGSIAEYDLSTRERRTRQTVTEAVPLARSGNRERAVAVIDDSCCPLDGLVYDAATRSWLPGRSTVSQYGVTVSMDFAASRILIANTLFTGTLSAIGTVNPPGTAQPGVIAADGASTFWPTATGVSRVRLADGVVAETFNLGAQPTRLFLSPDGLTLIVATNGTVFVIDLW